MKQTELKLSGTEDFFVQEAFKSIRTNIQFCGKDIKMIALTSCHANEGKSTVSLHLGKSFAELNKKVLVVDTDMRKSVMAGRNTNSQNVQGLSEVLTGMADLKDCLYQTQYPTLHLLFAGKYPPNPVELLNSKNFSDLLMSVREEYDYVIVDTAPVGMVIDAAVVSPICDGVVLVVSDNDVRYSEAEDVVSQLKRSNSKILGIIHNNIGLSRRSSKDYYKHYGRYGKYYSNEQDK